MLEPSASDRGQPVDAHFRTPSLDDYDAAARRADHSNQIRSLATEAEAAIRLKQSRQASQRAVCHGTLAVILARLVQNNT